MNCFNRPRLRHRHGSRFLAAITLLVLASTVRADGLGALYDAAGGVTFSVHSATATRVEVWIYANPQGWAEGDIHNFRGRLRGLGNLLPCVVSELQPH